VELTGDVTPDSRALAQADIIITTPEKWDGISRSWQTRAYVKRVALLIIDEIHMLGADRGPILEVIVSRANYIAAHTARAVRILGLSTALANAHDLANWLGVDRTGLFNFSSSVRPVPLEYHIRGFEGKHYCPRMASMNKPVYVAIRTYSPEKPVLVFVSSRRQTRLTALDLIAHSAADDAKHFLRMPAADMDALLARVVDVNLKSTLVFGIGLHHAGLCESDRVLVEELFVAQRIQVLVATSTLAWGVNYPAHLVVIKGTEYYDGKSKRYIDYPITDILQMAGRAGRPQFDDKGVAVVFCEDSKKHFYKKFMFEPFPVESSLHTVLPDHFNAEIVAGTLATERDAVDYLTWTYFFRRLVMNPSYYGLAAVTDDSVGAHMARIVRQALAELESSGCIAIGGEIGPDALEPLALGRIASYYYLRHETMRLFGTRLKPSSTANDMLRLLSDALEFAELPVRHSEDVTNGELAAQCPLPLQGQPLDSPHTKCFLLLQAHLSQLALPIADYRTDTKSVLDQCVRVLQALIDIAAEAGYLSAARAAMAVAQAVVQARWPSDSPLRVVNAVTAADIPRLASQGVRTLAELMAVQRSRLATLFPSCVSQQIDEIARLLSGLPRVEMACTYEPPRPVGPETDKSDPNASANGVEMTEGLVRVVLESRGRGATLPAPRFPKPVEESWWLLAGDSASNTLLALRRLGPLRGRTETVLAINPPPTCGAVRVSLISGGMAGLDVEVDVALPVLASDATEADASEQAADGGVGGGDGDGDGLDEGEYGDDYLDEGDEEEQFESEQ
jgi:activating signal cointegrator complex subunit 3